MEAREIGRVHQDLDIARGEFADAARVIRMTVRADDPVDLADRSTVPGKVALEEATEAAQSGVDEHQARLEEHVPVGTEELDRVDTRPDLHVAPCFRAARIVPDRRSVVTMCNVRAT